MIKGHGPALKSILARPGIWSSPRPGRCVSTKSAIHQALKKSKHRDERRSPFVDGAPRKPRARRTPSQEESRSRYRIESESKLTQRSRADSEKFDYGEMGPSAYSERRERGPRRDSYNSREDGRSPMPRGWTSSRAKARSPEYQDEERTSYSNRDDRKSRSAEDENDPLPGLGRRYTFTRRSRNSNADLSYDSERREPTMQSILEPEDREGWKDGAVNHRSRLGGTRRDAWYEAGDKVRGRLSTSSYQRSYSGEDEASEPLTLPYTTPASEFLYGRSVVVAAMEAKRRKLYKLYIHQGPKRNNDQSDMSMRKRALNLGIPVERVTSEGLRMMDRMSEGRPHNGFVLEASPLPKLPVTSFDRLEHPGETFSILLDHQTCEDADVNGTSTQISYRGAFPRFPFVLLLDGILDPGNLGAILRTAFFLGVDAVALTTNQSAPLSSVALKASAGASEAIPIVTVKQTRSFLDTCKDNGWAIYSSGASALKSGATSRQRHSKTSSLHDPLVRHPCIMLLGSEGQGLYKDVQQAADHIVHVEGQRLGQAGVDSLNVSVAAGLLCEAFLRKPATFAQRCRFKGRECAGEQQVEVDEDRALHIRDRLF